MIPCDNCRKITLFKTRENGELILCGDCAKKYKTTYDAFKELKDAILELKDAILEVFRW